ncbi:uncharacterized protein K444DRAFT_48346 [Hyaloscypha bicolor E]|uniref:Secreted protein n=1 Tax=Hyaloscypha bicolor E TaxID=1095630 RepID=A0A2J6T2A1_9HELO|nr:uncharacterized protein K444DRAFT_48346 [Hyaloscypha bicolor E]PMD57154.1 hypothetical protein K444DRAFT_48346 [Hyaloscypha bicolor E]
MWMSLIVALSILLSSFLLIDNLKECKSRTGFSIVTLGNEKVPRGSGRLCSQKVRDYPRLAADCPNEAVHPWSQPSLDRVNGRNPKHWCMSHHILKLLHKAVARYCWLKVVGVREAGHSGVK